MGIEKFITYEVIWLRDKNRIKVRKSESREDGKSESDFYIRVLVVTER